MDDSQKKYYKDMLERNRGHIFIKDGHVAAIATFFIGDDDGRYLYNRVPWTVIPDDSNGTTLYIDQLLVKDHQAHGVMHREFALFLKWVKNNFPNIKRAKWVRVDAAFRKHGIKEGVKSNVYIKDIK